MLYYQSMADLLANNNTKIQLAIEIGDNEESIEQNKIFAHYIGIWLK